LKKLNPSRIGAIAAAAALTVGLAAGPASAKGRGPTLKSLNKTLTSLEKTIKTVQKNVAAATKTANAATTGLAATNTALKSTNTALATLETAGGQAINALTALSTAVQSPTTGLPGLNAARPLIGAVVSNAAATGSEFTLTHAAAGTYILSFVNGLGTATAVNTRSVVITPFPNPGVDVNIQAANCAAAGVTCPGSDTAATDELVITQDGAAPTDENFQVAAISG